MATIDAPPVIPPTPDSSSRTIETLLARLRGEQKPTTEELAFRKPQEAVTPPAMATVTPSAEGSGAAQAPSQTAPAWETNASMGASTQEVPVIPPVAPEAIPQAVQQSTETTVAVQNAAGQTVIGEPTFAPASVANAATAETSQLVQKSGAVPPAIPSADANVGPGVDQAQVVAIEPQAVAVVNTDLETVRPPLSEEQRESAAQVVTEIAANAPQIIAFIKGIL